MFTFTKNLLSSHIFRPSSEVGIPRDFGDIGGWLFSVSLNLKKQELFLRTYFLCHARVSRALFIHKTKSVNKLLLSCHIWTVKHTHPSVAQNTWHLRLELCYRCVFPTHCEHTEQENSRFQYNARHSATQCHFAVLGWYSVNVLRLHHSLTFCKQHWQRPYPSSHRTLHPRFRNNTLQLGPF